MYEKNLAEIYDLIYRGRGKQYRTESEKVAELVRHRNSGADSILDVACGTGGHLAHFADLFSVAEGVEVSADMIAAARRASPGLVVRQGDMRDFRLEGSPRYAAVVCMFSSIGYMASEGELGDAVESMAAHLEPGGVLVVEPWVFPEDFEPGYVAGDVVREGGWTIARVSHSPRVGDRVPMEVHYTVANSGGIAHFTDRHHLTLFTRKAYEAAFERAGCSVEYVREEGFPLGLLVGRRS
ncbi:methyltransferase domain-containing protein [Nocardiopsis dassonvillei]|uniref:class I SAM-dependent methyltransferase n=1 Tax=Nocardiopsis dassonvillei TaxID=2014 RepID=UPI00200C46B7|nr:class I SAM-dependent methyltransferase [Nocardiopsis dassonvillei]MCK9874172.1 class I SAM-dependent methyltransferase [Nocardiopsis dassonvillei]